MDSGTDQAKTGFGGSSSLEWLNPFHSQYNALETSLSPQECCSLIQDQVAGSHEILRGVRLYDCSRPITGSAAGDSFEISRCVPYLTAYRPLAKGKLVREEQRTVVSCRTAVSRASLAGAPFGLLGVAYVGLIFLRFVRIVDWDIFTVLKVALLPYIGTVFLRLYVYRGHRLWLLQFLKTTLQAQDAPSPVVAPDGRSVDARQLYRMLTHVSARTRLIQAVVLVAIIAILVLIGSWVWTHIINVCTHTNCL